MNIPERPLPVPTDVTRPYWQAASDERLVIQRCADCGTHQFYPRAFCTRCLSERMDWVPCSGMGTIYTYTINHRGANAFMAQRTPYAVAVIQLDEGVRMLTNLVDSPLERIEIGKRVRVAFERVSADIALPQFVLDE